MRMMSFTTRKKKKSGRGKELRDYRPNKGRKSSRKEKLKFGLKRNRCPKKLSQGQAI